MGGWVHALCIGVQSPAAANTLSGAADSPAPIGPVGCPVIGRHEYFHLVKLRQIIRFHRRNGRNIFRIVTRHQTQKIIGALCISHPPLSLPLQEVQNKKRAAAADEDDSAFWKGRERGARAAAQQRGKCFLAN